jgi:hypothetical protein
VLALPRNALQWPHRRRREQPVRLSGNVARAEAVKSRAVALLVLVALAAACGNESAQPTTPSPPSGVVGVVVGGWMSPGEGWPIRAALRHGSVRERQYT